MSVVDRLRCDVPADWANDFSQCLFEWQGLEGGALALAAAVFGVIYLRRQITQSDRHERERLERQHNAVRATLPLTLSGLIEAMRQMLIALDDAKRDVRADGFASNFEPPATPVQHITELQAVIESTGDRTVIEPISQVIREIQTLWSRTQVLGNEREQRRRAGLERNVDEWIIQAAQVHALIESLFNYARGESQTGPTEVAWERAEFPIFQLGIESKSLVERIAAGVEKSPNFWSLNDR